jgi:DNA-binding response OmpR family regulator
MIIILSQDLMLSSSASAAARQQGRTLKTCSTLENASGLISAGGVKLLLIDLQMPQIDVAAVGQAIAAIAAENHPHVVAYAQHVHVDLLKSAREQGFDEVLTRGQISSGLPDLIERYA